MEKNYKVEAKGSLFEVTLTSGAYSDWDKNVYVFAGNSIEEVWEFVKQWANEGGIPNEYKSKLALTFGELKHQFSDTIYGDKINPEEIDWDNDYGHTYEVEIKRLEVIYVTPKVK